MGKTEKYSYEFMRHSVEEKEYKLITTEDEYVNSSTKLKLICKLGHECSISFSNLYTNNRGCKLCGVEKRASKRRTPLDSVIKVIEGNGYKIISGLDKYKNTYESRLILKCPEGHEWKEVTYKSFNKGHRCPTCKKVAKYDIEFARESFNKRGFNLLANEYNHAHFKMPYTCNLHPEKIQFISLSCVLRGINCKECFIESISGSNSYMWNENLTDEERIIGRDYPEYSQWRKDVFGRDNYTCQCCGKSEGRDLIAHHLDAYHWCIEKRTDIDNGITLCENCHNEFHKQYWNHNNTKEQFYEFMKIQFESKGGKKVI